MCSMGERLMLCWNPLKTVYNGELNQSQIFSWVTSSHCSDFTHGVALTGVRILFIFDWLIQTRF